MQEERREDKALQAAGKDQTMKKPSIVSWLSTALIFSRFSYTDGIFAFTIERAHRWIKLEPPKPIVNSVVFFPPKYYSSDVVYTQGVAPKSIIKGLSNLQAKCEEWERNFETNEEDVSFCLERVSQVSPTSLIAQWNLTWVPPTAQWLVRLAELQNWEPNYISYTEKAGVISSFSYVSVLKLFVDAYATKFLRIPQACIQGTTTCQLEEEEDGKTRITRIREDISYVQDLNRGYLKNRKCAQDLKLFLESARCVGGSNWDDYLETTLPWRSVPGMMGLEVDPNESGEEWVPAVFLVFSVLSIVGFSSLLAPELILGPPSYDIGDMTGI